MNKNKNLNLMEMFWIFLKISSFTFGGGYTIVPVIKEKFSIKRMLISESEMLDIVSIATSGPGPMAINASILTGYRLFGLKGGIIASIASAIPSLVIITIISFFYQEFSNNNYVKAALTGMGGVISAILLITSYNMGKIALKTNPVFSLIIMVCAFSASYFFNINTGLIILVVGIIGLILFTIVSEDKIPWFYLLYL